MHGFVHQTGSPNSTYSQRWALILNNGSYEQRDKSSRAELELSGALSSACTLNRCFINKQNALCISPTRDLLFGRIFADSIILREDGADHCASQFYSDTLKEGREKLATMTCTLLYLQRTCSGRPISLMHPTGLCGRLIFTLRKLSS